MTDLTLNSKQVGGERNLTSGDTKTDSNPSDAHCTEAEVRGMIHPIIMFPYKIPPIIRHFEKLYEELVSKLQIDNVRYKPSITVINNQTRQRQDGEQQYRTAIDLVKKYSEPSYVWSVDTCQMWLFGFGKAYERGKAGDIYWLIPGDFQYDSEQANEAKTLQQMQTIPNHVNSQEHGQTIELCVGEIEVKLNSAKQLIDYLPLRPVVSTLEYPCVVPRHSPDLPVDPMPDEAEPMAV